MNKDQIIFNLYGQLNNSGQKGDAQKFIANLCNVKINTVKNHWLTELPDHLEDSKKDEITKYLEDQIEKSKNTLVD